ncbi:MAG: GDP-mannose pyrophosphatase NudK [Mucilaginibacter sp.]
MKKIEILGTEILSDNWYRLKKITYRSTYPDGTEIIQSREAYDRGNGATILLYNKANESVILTRQFRMPTYINGNADGYMIECCAGLLDADSPEICIRRETEEETGYKISHVQKVFEAYMSPGSVTEILYFFIAEYESQMKISAGGGLAHEHEDIDVLELPFANALAMISSGEIKDAKTIMLLQHLRINNIL